MSIIFWVLVILCGLLSGTISRRMPNRKIFIFANIYVACIAIPVAAGFNYNGKGFSLIPKQGSQQSLPLDIDSEGQRDLQLSSNFGANAQEFRIKSSPSGGETSDNSYGESGNQLDAESLAALQREVQGANEKILDLRSEVEGLSADLEERADNQEDERMIAFLLQCALGIVTYISSLFAPYLTKAVSSKMEDRFENEDESEGGN